MCMHSSVLVLPASTVINQKKKALFSSGIGLSSCHMALFSSISLRVTMEPDGGNSAALPWARSALERFRTRTAIVHIDTELTTPSSTTYGELIQMASCVAAMILRLVGHQPTGIGLCLDNGLCNAVMQMAVIWAGSHFVPVPIDLTGPGVGALLETVLKGVSLVVTCGPSLVDELTALCGDGVKIVSVEEAVLRTNAGTAPACSTREDPMVTADGRRRFCTFHTSGTTGRPKPVHSTHAEFAAFCHAVAAPYRITASSRIFVATSHIFDPSAGMCFAAWAAGAAVCLAPWQPTLRHLRQYVELTCATHACSTPSVWALYCIGGNVHDDRDRNESSSSSDAMAAEGSASGPSTIVLGGEPMPIALIRLWLRRGACVINTYGTTEATVYQFAYRMPLELASAPDDVIAEHALRLGTPFEGVHVRVAALDDDAHDGAAPTAATAATAASTRVGSPSAPASTAALGELLLSGLQVGSSERWRGRERSAGGDTWELCTGDLVRSITGGAAFHAAGLAFAGRADKQVKLNGRRVELGPVEAAITLAMEPLVSRTSVLLVRKRLHAFCEVGALLAAHATASAEWAAVHAAAVHHFCRLLLPTYISLRSVLFLEQLPVTATGKTDECTLAAMDNDEMNATPPSQELWTPQTERERAVARCWALELGLPIGQLSATSDFRRLSGNSLVALRIVERLWRLRPAAAGQAGMGAERSGEGGVFAEFMGAYAPARLLSTPILAEYAAMLTAADDGDGVGNIADSGEVVVVVAPVVSEGGGSAGAGAGAAAAAAAGGSGSMAQDLNDAEDAMLPLPKGRTLTALDSLISKAVGVGARELVLLLLQRADCTLSTGLVDDLLISAVRGGHHDCAAHLLAHGASPNAAGVGRMPVLSIATTGHGGEQITRLLLASHADVRTVDHNGQTAVHHFARTGGDTGCLQMLLTSWDDATATSVPAPATTAATGGALENDQLHGGACGQQDKWGRTPLHWATANGHRDAIVALVEAGSDMWQEDNQRESSMALAERRAECREWLNGQDGVRCDKLTLQMLRLMT